MKQNTHNTFERKLWIFGAVGGIAASIFAYFVGLFLQRFTPEPGLDPIVLSIIALMIGLSLPILMKAFAAPKRLTTWEYKEADESFEEDGNQLILQTFGSEAFEKLYVDDQNWIPTSAIDVCGELLRRKEGAENPDLRFYLYAKLARYYARDGQHKEAIHMLNEALAIKPTSLIANYRAATLYESIGSAEDAIRHYLLAEKDHSVSKNLKNYLESQIQRVRTKGPRQQGPYDHSGFQWLPG